MTHLGFSVHCRRTPRSDEGHLPAVIITAGGRPQTGDSPWKTGWRPACLRLFLRMVPIAGET
jgi:hypothetical protein